MKLLKVDTIDQAREKLENHIKSWPVKTDRVSVNDALDRILAENIYAPSDIPSFDRSTVDGYAVKACETAAAAEAVPVSQAFTA